MNLGNLRSHMIALLNRSDLTNTLADTFIEQSIQRIQRNLRIPAMEATFNLTVTTQTPKIILPHDFLELIEIFHSSKSMTRIPHREMMDFKISTVAGLPDHFTRVRADILLYPEPTSGVITLLYYKTFDTMSADSDENILAKIASDLIIYGALVYAGDYFLDERAQLYEGKYQQFMMEIQEQATDAELVGNLQVIRPANNLNLEY